MVLERFGIGRSPVRLQDLLVADGGIVQKTIDSHCFSPGLRCVRQRGRWVLRQGACDLHQAVRAPWISQFRRPKGADCPVLGMLQDFLIHTMSPFLLLASFFQHTRVVYKCQGSSQGYPQSEEEMMDSLFLYFPRYYVL